MKKAASILLAFAFVLSLLAITTPTAAQDASDVPTDFDRVINAADFVAGSNITVNDGETVKITGTTTTNRISVPDDIHAQIVLENLHITKPSNGSPLNVHSNATADIWVIGSVTLEAADGSSDAGLFANQDATLNLHMVDGATLAATGGTINVNGDNNNGTGAGLGGNGTKGSDASHGENTGNISIDGEGTVIATGGSITTTGDNYGGTGAGFGGGGAGDSTGDHDNHGGHGPKNDRSISVSGAVTLIAKAGSIEAGTNYGGTGAGFGGGGAGRKNGIDAKNSGGDIMEPGTVTLSGSATLFAEGGSIITEYANYGGTGAGFGGGGAGYAVGNNPQNRGGEIGFDAVVNIAGSAALATATGGNITADTNTGGTGAGFGGGGAGDSSGGLSKAFGGRFNGALTLSSGILLDGSIAGGTINGTGGGAGANLGNGGSNNGNNGNNGNGDPIENIQTVTYTGRAGTSLTLSYIDKPGDHDDMESDPARVTMPTADYLRQVGSVSLTKYTDLWYSEDGSGLFAEGAEFDIGDLPQTGTAYTLYATSPLYAITTDLGMENGSLAVSPGRAYHGQEIGVRPSPAENYRLSELYSINGGQRKDIPIGADGNAAFIMPNGDATLYATFAQIPEPPDPGEQYEIATGKNIQNGQISANKAKAYADDIVSVTLRPDREFAYDEGTLYYIEEETGHKTFIEDYDEGRDKYSFIMPADNITIYAEFIPVLYEITIDENIELGAIDTDVFEAAKGQTVTVSVFPDDIYQLIEGSLTYQLDGKKPVRIENHQFEMPSGDIEITARFELKEIYIFEDHLYDKEGNQLFNQEYTDENGDRYYFGEDGAMLRDAFRFIENSLDVYYYSSNGKMLKNGWVDDYYFGADGKMLRNSWLQEGDNHYYFGEDGLLYRDVLIKIGDYWYYFDPDGVMVKDAEVSF